MSNNPKKVFCLSGKRKTGKDYIAEILHKRIPGSAVIRLSAPIKEHWAKSMNLDLKELLGDSNYKEHYRAQMITWGEEKRREDPSFFCLSAIEMTRGNEHPVWIVADMRRLSDLQFFQDNYPGRVTSVRIRAADQVRAQRGFQFVSGIDDAESECGLDLVTDWDLIVQNDGDATQLEDALRRLIDLC
nr:EOG090X0FYC [Ilyocryptus agilis]